MESSGTNGHYGYGKMKRSSGMGVWIWAVSMMTVGREDGFSVEKKKRGH